MKNTIWKTLALLLVGWSLIGGLIIEIPELPVVGESIRNMFFHVSMWFVMTALLIYSVICSIKYLSSNKEKYDIAASTSVNIGLLFGVLGLLTGMVWAKFTWGKYWMNDPKLNGAAIAALAYFAYNVLRSSVSDINKRGRLSAIYNIFAFIIMLIFVFILPRMGTDSIHPGSADNPALPMGLSPAMRLVFYPALVGWILIGFWILNLKIRINKLNILKNERH